MEDKLLSNIMDFIRDFSIDKDENYLSGNFSLLRSQPSRDLYGMIDVIYILSIIDELQNLTNKESRSIWANRILQCQDQEGWFTKNNYRGHVKEHATAYAVGGLKLLEITDNENYLESIAPINGIRTYFNHNNFIHLMKYQGMKLSLKNFKKYLGWNYIWNASHISGGIAAIIGQTQELMGNWWDSGINAQEWLDNYCEFLTNYINNDTGLWQRAAWNVLIRKPTTIDLGGAAHFYWIYEKHKCSYPNPENLIDSILYLQKESGLYKDHPLCIDFDANFCLLRSFNQLNDELKKQYKGELRKSINNNVSAIENYLFNIPPSRWYDNIHSLPGALAAIVESYEIIDSSKYKKWNNPFDKVWWL